MTTFLSILLAIFLVLFAAVFIGLLWLRAKARKAGAHFLVASLKAALVGLRDKAAKPENANDKELADLIARLDTAHAQAREALNKEDYTGALKIVAPFLEELAAYRQAEERKRANSPDAIDVDVSANQPASQPLQLPAPGDAAATPSDAAAGNTNAQDNTAGVSSSSADGAAGASATSDGAADKK